MTKEKHDPEKYIKLKEELQSIQNPPIVLIDGDKPYITKKKNIFKNTEEDYTLCYETNRMGFNKRFKVRPAAIVFCTNEQQVAHVVKIAKNHKEFPLRVRSTGHDHEGESTGTDAIVIDFVLMNNFSINNEEQTATIYSGVIFKDIIPALDQKNVSIPHGTCETVGVMGFALGGGWGPWTRRNGMCCEHIIGATLIDGKGDLITLSETDTDQKSKELLWALKGGGGFSYGIVINLILKTFNQPKFTLRFSVHWNSHIDQKNIPAIKILKHWENAIAAGKNHRLIGTNLQINTIPEDSKTIETSIHESIFYGYYGADTDNSKQLETLLYSDLKEWFPDMIDLDYVKIVHDKETDDIKHNFSVWGRISQTNQKHDLKSIKPILTHFPPDVDDSAPHKISSRLVKESGLGDEGRKTLIKSLRSNLICKEGIDGGLHTYVTLGAISGVHYDTTYTKPIFPDGFAFPYSKRPYIIQYQVWWNETEADKTAGNKFHVNDYVNKAMDWIQECRDRNFEQTNGSFISFKDSSIPTSKYFPDVYEKLQNIKEKYVNDEDNLFRSRKTIL